MLQIGIRLHDVNTACAPEMQTLEARAKTAREEGFCCVHLAPQKVMKGVAFEEKAFTEGLGHYFHRVFGKNDLDIAVLGCYMNLATPDEAQLRTFQGRYYGSIRTAARCNCGMVGTETGTPNREYKPDRMTRSDEALDTFIRNLAPVVECAENYGVTLAIEPVLKHIVYNADRALQVIRSIGSRNLRIIFDPVNLLGSENVDRRDDVIRDAMDKLCDHIAMVHLKDFVRGENDLVSVAAGEGGMDYREILRFLKANKPCIQATLENTANENAVRSRQLIERIYSEV